jgi:hypothetical protein
MRSLSPSLYVVNEIKLIILNYALNYALNLALSAEKVDVC